MKIRINSLIEFINEAKKLQELFLEANKRLFQINEDLKSENSGQAINSIVDNINRQIKNNNEYNRELDETISFYDKYIKDLNFFSIIEDEDKYFVIENIEEKIIDTNSSINSVENLIEEYKKFDFYELYGKEVRDYENLYYNITKEPLESDIDYSNRKDLYYNQYQEAKTIEHEIINIKNSDIPILEDSIYDLQTNLKSLKQLKELEEQDQNFIKIGGILGNLAIRIKEIILSAAEKKEEFKNMFIEQYGFDEGTAKILVKLYYGLEERYPNDVDFEFNLIIGIFYYEDQKN